MRKKKKCKAQLLCKPLIPLQVINMPIKKSSSNFYNVNIFAVIYFGQIYRKVHPYVTVLVDNRHGNIMTAYKLLKAIRAAWSHLNCTKLPEPREATRAIYLWKYRRVRFPTFLLHSAAFVTSCTNGNPHNSTGLVHLILHPRNYSTLAI